MRIVRVVGLERVQEVRDRLQAMRQRVIEPTQEDSLESMLKKAMGSTEI